jgi:hypothetical protein
MNKLEQFIAVYEPQGDKNIGFRKMLDEIILETKNKPAHEVIGMRDYFAAKAMSAIIIYDQGSLAFKGIAEDSYKMADAMMEARNG